MIEFDPEVVRRGLNLELEASSVLPSKPGFYRGEHPDIPGHFLLAELKADGKFHTGNGTWGDPERYAPWKPLVLLEEAASSLSYEDRAEIAAEVLEDVVKYQGPGDRTTGESAGFLARAMRQFVAQCRAEKVKTESKKVAEQEEKSR